MIKFFYCFIIIVLLCASNCYAQEVSAFSINSKLPGYKELYIIDTMTIYDPIVIIFGNNDSSSGTSIVLVSKKYLDQLPNSIKQLSYQEFVSYTNASLFVHYAEFSLLLDCLLRDSISQEDSLCYLQFKKELKFATKPVFVDYDIMHYVPKYYKGWEYIDIYPHKFLVCLVKGSSFPCFISSEEIGIRKMNNVYFKIAIPMSW